MRASKDVVIYQMPKETMLQSVVSDVVTYGSLILCIWASYTLGGGWWTFVTTLMFIVIVGSQVKSSAPTRIIIRSKKKAIEWAHSLPD